MAPRVCATCGGVHVEGSPDCPAARLDSLIDRQYHLESILGMGGIGVVYAGTDRTLKQPVAVKMLLSTFAQDQDMQERFRREAWAAARVSAHPGIVRVLRVGATEDGCAYLVMERLTGDTLRSWYLSGPRNIARLVWAVSSILDVLDFAHSEGLVHRDLKPSNLYVTRLGTSENVKVLDFGIVHLAWEEMEALTQTGSFLGSVYYTSPEQLMNSKAVKPQADLYSIGAVMFNLLTRKMVVSAPNPQMEMVSVARGDIRRHPREFQPLMPEWLDAVVAQCLAFKPEERPPTARALADALRNGLKVDPASAEMELADFATEDDSLELLEATGGTFSMTSILGREEDTLTADPLHPSPIVGRAQLGPERTWADSPTDSQTTMKAASLVAAGTPPASVSVSSSGMQVEAALDNRGPQQAPVAGISRGALMQTSLEDEHTVPLETSHWNEPEPGSAQPSRAMVVVLALILLLSLVVLLAGVWRLYEAREMRGERGGRTTWEHAGSSRA